jgi:hypothetical protein
MAVGITILSGDRRGEELGLDQPEFRAGDDSTYELFFDPSQYPGAVGRRALFRLGSDGWYLKNTGDGTLIVNGAEVGATIRMRSGDVVGLSAAGPEFVFKLLANLPTGATRPSPRPQPARTGQAGASESQSDGNNAPVGGRKLATVAALALGMLAGFLVLLFLLRRPSTPPDSTAASTKGVAVSGAVDQHPGSPNETDVAATPREVSASLSGDQAHRNEPAVDQNVGAELADPASGTPASDTKSDTVSDAVLLLLVEEPKSASAWPFGSATAISDRMLLTSATVATGLSEFRKKGWKLWAINQRRGIKIQISDLRVHAGFVAGQADPEKQIYADLGLLGIAEPIAGYLPLASPEELSELDRGSPVRCQGYFYENEPINRFQTFLPESYAGKVFVITSLPPSPGGPRLMHVHAELPGKLYGGPIVSKSGCVLGVFAETAVSVQQEADLQLHYAPIVDPVLLDRWLKDRDTRWWVAPAERPAARTAPEN